MFRLADDAVGDVCPRYADLIPPGPRERSPAIRHRFIVSARRSVRTVQISKHTGTVLKVSIVQYGHGSLCVSARLLQVRGVLLSLYAYIHG